MLVNVYAYEISDDFFIIGALGVEIVHIKYIKKTSFEIYIWLLKLVAYYYYYRKSILFESLRSHQNYWKWHWIVFAPYDVMYKCKLRNEWTIDIQWATLVTHHFFRAHIFWQKCWNQTFSMIIYLLTFYLFVDIKNIFRITHAKHSAASKAILLTLTKMHVQPERLYFLFAFCARHHPWWSLWQKNTKNNYFIQVKPLFSVVEFSNTVTFWWNSRFYVI